MNEKRSVDPPDGGYGWVVIAACVVINSTLAPLIQCFGIIYEGKFQEMNIPAAEIAFLLHFHSSVMCSLGLVSGPLLKRYDFKQTTMFGCFLVCTGVTLSAFVYTYGQLIFAVCILIGIGQGILMPSTALAINSYFRDRLTLAMSWSVTGVGLIPIVIPQICNLLLNSYGIKGTVLILAAVSYNSFLGALLLRPLTKISNRKKSIPASPLIDTKLQLDGKEIISEEPQTTQKQSNRIKGMLHALFDIELFKDRTYVIITIGMSVSYVSELNFNVMMPFVLSEFSEFTRDEVALAISILATADISGRLILPLISHKNGWSPKFAYALSLVGSSLGRIIIAIACDARNVIFPCIVLLGLSKGAKAVFQSLILPKYVSMEKFASAMGFLMVSNGILSLSLGPIIGVVHDFSGSYAYALHAATFMSISCVILWILDYYQLKRKQLPDICEQTN